MSTARPGPYSQKTEDVQVAAKEEKKPDHSDDPSAGGESSADAKQVLVIPGLPCINLVILAVTTNLESGTTTGRRSQLVSARAEATRRRDEVMSRAPMFHH